MEKDKKYRRIGFWTATLTQVVIFILFYFLIAWREPSPPIPSYGIELSFGLEETGQGEVAPSSPEVTEELEEIEEVIEEQTEEVAEEVPTEAEVVEEADVEEVPITETPSPDVVEEQEAVTPPSPAKEEQPIQEEVKEVQNPPKTTAVDETVSPSQGTTAEPGDEGNEEGTLDDRAIYGSQGSGSNGASLQMAGWVWDARPNPNDKTDETGKIVYKIKIDDEGYIIDIELQSSTVKPAVERLYRQSVERLSFSKTTEYKPAPTSSGTITFLIQSK